MIEFTAYNDARADVLHTRKNLLSYLYIATFIALFISILAIKNMIFLLVWIIPLICLLLYCFTLILVKYEKTFLIKDVKKKHKIVVSYKNFYKDGKIIRDLKKCHLYKFKKYLLLEFNEKSYIIDNNDYSKGNRNSLIKRLNVEGLNNKFIFKPIFKCACCGCYTLNEFDSREICPVCFWENDLTVLINDKNEVSLQNGLTITKARENYKLFGAFDKEMVKFVRKPREEEIDNRESEEYY